MGGMAALIPSRKRPGGQPARDRRVRADKEREAGLGFDGTWVAHPDVVGVARDAFDAVLGERPNQIDRQRDDVDVDAAELLDARLDARARSPRPGLRGDVNVGFQYLSFWLGGRGAAGIDNLMEDAATAEISRSQLWQWIHHGATLEDGRTVTRELVRAGARRGDGPHPRRGRRRGLGARAGRRRPARSSSSVALVRRLPRVPHAARL